MYLVLFPLFHHTKQLFKGHLAREPVKCNKICSKLTVYKGPGVLVLEKAGFPGGQEGPGISGLRSTLPPFQLFSTFGKKLLNIANFIS